MLTSNIFTIIGLVLELVAGIIIAGRLFWEKERRTRDKKKTYGQISRDEKTLGLLVIILLIVGVSLQVLDLLNMLPLPF